MKVVAGKTYRLIIPPIEQYCQNFDVQGKIILFGPNKKPLENGTEKVFKPDDSVWVESESGPKYQVRAEWLGEEVTKSRFKIEIRIDDRTDKLFIMADDKYRKRPNELACKHRPMNGLIIAVYDDKDNMLYTDNQGNKQVETKDETVLSTNSRAVS